MKDKRVGVIDLLKENEAKGHAYLTVNDALLDYLRRNRNYDLRKVDFFTELASHINNGYVINNTDNLYIKRTWNYECIVVENLIKLISNNKHNNYTVKNYSNKLSNEQYDAVAMAIQEPISVILGGAGTGKTTLIRGIIDEYRILTHGIGRLKLCAPTGKAAIRLQQATGFPTQTIHGLLGKLPKDFIYYRSAVNRTNSFSNNRKYKINSCYVFCFLFLTGDNCKENT